MKAFFVAFLAVAAADPNVLYTGLNPTLYNTAGVYGVHGIQTPYLGAVSPVVQPVVQPIASTYIKPEVKAQKVTTYVEKKENKVQPDLYSKVEKKVEYDHIQPVNTVYSAFNGQPIQQYSGFPVAVNPVVTKKYEAKNGEVEHVVINKEHPLYKREAEADPLFVSPYTTGIYNPVLPATVYNTHSLVYNTPSLYNGPVSAFNPITRQYHAKSAPGVEHSVINKREAESDPALLIPRVYSSPVATYPYVNTAFTTYTGYPRTVYSYPRTVYGF